MALDDRHHLDELGLGEEHSAVVPRTDNLEWRGARNRALETIDSSSTGQAAVPFGRAPQLDRQLPARCGSVQHRVLDRAVHAGRGLLLREPRAPRHAVGHVHPQRAVAGAQPLCPRPCRGRDFFLERRSFAVQAVGKLLRDRVDVMKEQRDRERHERLVVPQPRRPYRDKPVRCSCGPRRSGCSWFWRRRRCCPRLACLSHPSSHRDALPG